jgi:hypothetical protein
MILSPLLILLNCITLARFNSAGFQMVIIRELLFLKQLLFDPCQAQ